MDGLELHMNEARLDQQGEIWSICVQEKFKAGHAIENQVGGRWYKNGISRPASTNPVLTLSEFASLLLAATSLREEHMVNLTNQPQRQRKSRTQSLQTVVHG